MTVAGCDFQRPAYVDLFSGEVYALPEKTLIRQENEMTLNALPVYDSPILVVEQSLLELK